MENTLRQAPFKKMVRHVVCQPQAFPKASELFLIVVLTQRTCLSRRQGNYHLRIAQHGVRGFLKPSQSCEGFDSTSLCFVRSRLRSPWHACNSTSSGPFLILHSRVKCSITSCGALIDGLIPCAASQWTPATVHRSVHSAVQYGLSVEAV